jgi:hypothetical protein
MTCPCTLPTNEFVDGYRCACNRLWGRGADAPVADLCECCDLPPESCGKAAEQQQRRERKARRERALQEPGVVPARHPIPACPGCREPVLVGEPIRRTVDGWVGVLCCDGLDQ